MSGQAPASWHPDPFGRHEVRYWDGGQWTHHVVSRGSQLFDPPVGGPPAPTIQRAGVTVQQPVRRAGLGPNPHTDGVALFTEPVLVVNQKAKLFEVKAEYAVYDQHGRQIGAVREVGRSMMRKAMGPPDRNATHRFQVVDQSGRVLMALTRPANLLKSKMIVASGDGTQIGQIVQKNLGIFGFVHFRLESGGQLLGSLNAEGRAAWDFNIQDATGTEIARITKTWAGLAKEWFTKADKYVVEIHRPLEDPLRSLVVAAALAVDTALKQESDWSNRRSR